MTIFISATTQEFGEDRSLLCSCIARSGWNCINQNTIGHSSENTLDKLFSCIEECDAVIQLYGQVFGSSPSLILIDQFLTRHPEFLRQFEESSREGIDLQSLSYTNWESLISLWLSKPLLVYQLDSDNTHGNSNFLSSLRKIGSYSETFTDSGNLMQKLTGDLIMLHKNLTKIREKIYNNEDAEKQIDYKKPDDWFE